MIKWTTKQITIIGIMLKTIYEKIANKNQDFGCIIKVTNSCTTKDELFKWYDRTKNWPIIFKYIGDWNLIKDFEKTNGDSKYLKVIWHPIMFGDAFDYFKVTNLIWDRQMEITSKLIILWKEKRKPIEKQSKECIKYIYNLIINKQ